MQTKQSLQVMMLLLIVVGLSGCTSSGQYNSVVFGGGSEDQIAIVDGMFVMKGDISVGTGAAPDQNFSDVTVVLYDERKQVVKRVRIGNLSTNPAYYPTAKRINITSETIPTYVVIESPDFWTSETPLEIEGHNLENGTYHTYPIGKDHRFPDE